MSGWSAHFDSENLCKDGKCPLCGATVDVLSEVDDHYRWECTSCDKIFRRRVEDNPT